jgi:hypothetical protein
VVAQALLDHLRVHPLSQKQGCGRVAEVVKACFADRSDWQLPKISELQTILIGPEAAPGQATTCSAAPCIDPGFAAIGEPTVSLSYGSAPTFAGNPDYAWLASFTNGVVHNFFFKTDDDCVRAGSLERPTFCVEESFEKTGRPDRLPTGGAGDSFPDGEA